MANTESVALYFTNFNPETLNLQSAAYTVERALQLVTFGFERGFVGVGGDAYRRRDADDGAREGLWDLQAIPALQLPEAFGVDREGQRGLSRLLREQHRSHLRLVARAARAVNGEGRRAAPPHEAHHLDERADASARRGAARRAVAEALDEARDVLAVEALRGHHDDAAPSPEVGREKDAVVPEGVDRQPAVARSLLPVLPALDAEARGRAEQPDEQVEGEVGGANREPLAEGVAREVCEGVGAGDALVRLADAPVRVRVAPAGFRVLRALRPASLLFCRGWLHRFRSRSLAEARSAARVRCGVKSLRHGEAFSDIKVAATETLSAHAR